MKKKNLKLLKLNKKSISNFKPMEVNGGKRLSPTLAFSDIPEDCETITCGLSCAYNGNC